MKSSKLGIFGNVNWKINLFLSIRTVVIQEIHSLLHFLSFLPLIEMLSASNETYTQRT